MIEIGNLQMMEIKLQLQGEEVRNNIQGMLSFVSEISITTRTPKLVAFNLMAEAARNSSTTVQSKSSLKK
jgi:hypothetical protein